MATNMFDIDLIEKGAVLRSLLMTNPNMFFKDKYICSQHKHGMCMTVYRDSSIDVPEVMINDMSALDNVL